MTAQIPDSVRYEGEEYDLAGVNGAGLFDPAAHGVVPTGTSSANWRGFVASYVVRDGQLHLERLTLGLDRSTDQAAAPPVLFGTGPEEDFGFELEYTFDEAPIEFSGGVLLGKHFIEELYIHMGFAPAWKYRRVLELIFESGRLLRAHDRSSKVAKIRDRITSGRAPDPDAQADLIRWIDRTFELDYGRTFG